MSIFGMVKFGLKLVVAVLICKAILVVVLVVAELGLFRLLGLN